MLAGAVLVAAMLFGSVATAGAAPGDTAPATQDVLRTITPAPSG